jgi:hypothetical protein
VFTQLPLEGKTFDGGDDLEKKEVVAPPTVGLEDSDAAA